MSPRFWVLLCVQTITFWNVWPNEVRLAYQSFLHLHIFISLDKVVNGAEKLVAFSLMSCNGVATLFLQTTIASITILVPQDLTIICHIYNFSQWNYGKFGNKIVASLWLIRKVIAHLRLICFIKSLNEDTNDKMVGFYLLVK